MRPNLTLPLIDQGKPKVIIALNFVELENLMLHAKFQDPQTSGAICSKHCYPNDVVKRSSR